MVSCLRSVPSGGMSRARPIHRAAIVAGLALLVLTSCASGRIEETVDIDGTVVPARLKIATANVGGTYYPMGNAISQVLTSELPGVSATAETSGGSGQNIRMLDANQIHLALANAAITFPARQGAEGFEKQFPMEVVISLHASINLFLALEGTGIAEIADLKGKRVSVGPAGGGVGLLRPADPGRPRRELFGLSAYLRGTGECDRTLEGWRHRRGHGWREHSACNDTGSHRHS